LFQERLPFDKLHSDPPVGFGEEKLKGEKGRKDRRRDGGVSHKERGRE